MKKIKMIVGRILWETTEDLKIPLGKFAPIVFGWMIGCKGKKQKKT